MASTEAQDQAAKDRIIKHMNADHQDSVRRYIEHGFGISSYTARNAQMTDIDLDRMKIVCGSRRIVIPFQPPMKSLRDARERLVQMDKDALQALGRDSITINTFIPPTVHPLHLANFSVCFLTYLAFSRKGNFLPGSLLHDYLLVNFPRFTQFCITIQPFLFLIMVSIHAFETMLMLKKLQRHSVVLFSRVWWYWVGSCFVEGITSFKRLDGLIRAKVKERDSKRH
ncbi:integral membrane protein-like protein [Zopfia rhizophila CBS 207.26]|uniref:Integral membrane protein-like protein n=1 Tax=Zopfia rhizophila CBS 207.26 TaxID=1314779 RepID=A0A6A6EHE4_9PEZI|nr:integral membrane protein-like protein [Zopfia rhizophila CBS 207.26]